MFIKTSWISSGLFAAILLCFFLPFLDLKCNDALIGEVSGADLITGEDIHVAPEVSFNDDDSHSYVDRNYFAVVALTLALAGFILSLVMKEKREMFLSIIGLAGAMCLFLMRIQIMNKLSSDTDDTAKYIVNIEFVFGYWFTLILFLTVAFLNMYSFMEGERKALDSKHKL